MGKSYPVWLEEFTRGAFEDYLAEEKNPVAIVVIGSVEQHGAHLPLGMDMMAALGVAQRVAERTRSVVVHPCWPGYSPHHMAFAGTISFRAETLVNVLLDTIDSLATHGIKKILLLNGHGGNAEIMNYAARLGKRRSKVRIVTSNAWFSGTTPEEAIADVDRHAGAKETAVAQAWFAELVEMERVEGFEPTAAFPPDVEALRTDDPEDLALRTQLVMAYIDDTHQFTPSGIYGFEGADPNRADVEAAHQFLADTVEHFVRLITYWKTIDSE